MEIDVSVEAKSVPQNRIDVPVAVEPLICNVCCLSFTQEADLSEHSCIKRKFVCETCGKSYRWKDSLVIHQRCHTGEKPYACPMCPQRFVSSEGLKTHSVCHSPARPFTCNECGRSFKLKSTLRNHAKTHTGKRPHICNVCNRAFLAKNALIFHSYIHTGEKNFICEVCDKRFATPCRLRAHSRVHTDEKPYTCDWCDEKFSRRELLYKHYPVHGSQTPKVPVKKRILHPCTECDRSFVKKVSLEVHLQTHFGVSERFQCDECDKVLYHRETLRIHKRNKHKKKDLSHSLSVCMLCDEKFQSVLDFDSHLLTHEEMLHLCDICNRGSCCKSEIEEHRNTHVSVKPMPHICSVCTKGFDLLEDLRAHSAVHSRFACNSCDKSFASERGLNLHLHVHNGTWPHYCSVCSKGFSDFGAFRRHSKSQRHAQSIESNQRNTQSVESMNQRNVPTVVPYIVGSNLVLVQYSPVLEETEESDSKEGCQMSDGKQPLECNKCRKVFKKLNAFTRHLATHESKSCFICLKCDKDFTQKSKLLLHCIEWHI